MYSTRLKILEVAPNTGTTKLENCFCLPARNKLESFFIVQGQFLEIDLNPADFMNSVDRFFEACQVADAEEIHFKKPDRISGNVRIKRVHIVLSDDLAALRIVLERSVVIKRFRRDDYAGGVDRDVPRRAFQFFGQINDSFRIG